MRNLLLALFACFAFSVTARASDIMFNTNGTFASSGTYTASFLINSATEILDGGSITATVPGGSDTTYNFSEAGADSSCPGFELFTDANGDTFYLALNGAIGDLAVNTVPIWGTVDTHFDLASGLRFDAMNGIVAPAAAVAPEPSSLLLVATGAFGLVASFRRRIFSALPAKSNLHC
jgi:hypothetical protein